MEYIETSKLNDEKFAENFEDRVKATINEFELFNKNQKIIVAASGGKDSTVLMHLMKKFGYNIDALTINAHIGCYSEENLKKLRDFCKKEQIKLHEVSLLEEFGHKLCDIISIMQAKGKNKTSCSVCGTLRRYLLNKHSKELNADILLTGHNLDDESEGMMMTLFMGNLKQIAKLGILSENKSFVVKAKPLYFMYEDEVERYSKIQNFDVKYSWCPCSEKASRRFYSELEIEKEKKFNLLKNVVINIPKLKKRFKSEIKKCIKCEEPSSNDVCQACKIIAELKT